MPNILLIEDNPDLAAGICYNLKREGYQVELAADGAQGLQLARALRPDLIILDLMLPGIDGFEVLETLRAEGSRAPVLVLTARGEELDKVRAFRLDADQYVTKPFGLLELFERVRMLLRRAGARSEASEKTDLFRFGDVEVDAAAHQVRKNGQPVELRPKEYELLRALIARDGSVVSRHELLRKVWGHLGTVQTRTVDWHISELRRKLEDDSETPRHIHTVWKAGYRFQS